MKKRFLFWGPKPPVNTTVANTPVVKSTAIHPESFYEKAIEWTHRGDKVVNLVLGYLLAIASVLGFMDVLSNGEVLSHVPNLFYVWLAIMGLGVDFQLLLVVGRMPDLGRLINGWRKYVFFAFNISFLAFLAYMSIIIGAVFTQHRDVPGTITAAMNALGINSTDFVYERAALATLLLVLMAIDRTMERWRMQIEHAQSTPIEQPQSDVNETVSSAQGIDIEKVLQTMVTMNQQTLMSVQEQNRQALNVTIEHFTNITVEAVREAVASLPVGSPVPQIEASSEALGSSGVNTDEIAVISEDDTTNQGYLKDGQYTSRYAIQIEQLYQENNDISVPEIIRIIGCSRPVAKKWLSRVKPVTISEVNNEASQNE